MSKQEPRTKKPEPTKDGMEQFYVKKRWGGAEADLYSGEGLHKPALVNPYIAVVSNFIIPKTCAYLSLRG